VWRERGWISEIQPTRGEGKDPLNLRGNMNPVGGEVGVRSQVNGIFTNKSVIGDSPLGK